jgi:hypothetical protein
VGVKSTFKTVVAGRPVAGQAKRVTCSNPNGTVLTAPSVVAYASVAHVKGRVHDAGEAVAV